MPTAGNFGGPNSRLGNIVLGYGSALAAGQTVPQGVGIGEIGQKYDFAMGFDPGTGAATMYGYCIPSDLKWEESTQLQDVARLIQVSSASTTDRDLTRWPKVTQGDWSRGERQATFIDTARYYISDGNLDISQPGGLRLFPSAVNTTYTLTGTYNLLPMVSDGSTWYLGISQGGNNLLIGNAGGITAYNVAGGEILDMLMTPYGVFYATATGFYQVSAAGVVQTVTVADVASPTCRQSMAYFADKLYYVTTGDTVIKSINAITGGTPVTVHTCLAFETHIGLIASTASGLFFSKYRELGATSLVQESILYSFDGTTATRVGDVMPGLVKQAVEVNGTLFLLCQLEQASSRADYTLYTLTSSVATGAVLSILDDTRFIQFSDFWASNPSPTGYCRGSVFGDGRMLYIAWPGLKGLRLDLVTGGISRIGSSNGGNGVASLAAHRIVSTSSVGMVQVVGAASTATLSVYNGAAVSGVLTSSYMDFSTPALTKFFRSLEVDLFSALPQGASIGLAYSLDSSLTFTPLTAQSTTSTTIAGYFPAKTRASRMKLQITLSANVAGDSPIVSAYSLKANLGRVWKTTASCRTKQMMNNNAEDDQDATALFANFENAYANAGRCILYVPSPNADHYVEQVNATLEDYKWSAGKPAAKANEQHVGKLEGDVECTFSEQI